MFDVYTSLCWSRSNNPNLVGFTQSQEEELLYIQWILIFIYSSLSINGAGFFYLFLFCDRKTNVSFIPPPSTNKIVLQRGYEELAI